MPWKVEERDDEFCVIKEADGSTVKCHSSRADAVKHVKALYAAEPQGTMKYSVLSFADDILADSSEGDNIKWVKAWRYSTWDHPRYGKVEITPETGASFKEHFDSGAFGREHLINYEHGVDPAKGYKAAGKVLQIDPRQDGIYYKVEFNDVALNEIKNGEWYYLSPEYDDAYIDSETGTLYENMPLDLALTNTPYFKGQEALPLNFSELYVKPEVTIVPKGGNKVDELLKKFAANLGVELDDNASEEDILAKASELSETIEPLRRAKMDGERNRTFREAFPDEWKEMEKLRETRVESEARSFSENYRRFTIKVGDADMKSSFGFSELVIDEIAETYKKFATKTATPADLKKVLDQISDKGVVDYSEQGSNRETRKEFSEDPKMAFSQAVQDVMEQDNIAYEAAITVAQAKHPDLYDAYLRAIPQR
jgi:hypothetical protein